MIKNRKQFSAWVIGLLALSLAGCSEAEAPTATTPGDDPLGNDPRNHPRLSEQAEHKDGRHYPRRCPHRHNRRE